MTANSATWWFANTPYTYPNRHDWPCLQRWGLSLSAPQCSPLRFRSRSGSGHACYASAQLTCTFDELNALIEYVDKFIADKFRQKWLYETEEERVLLDAMEALAAALPSRLPR